MTVVTFGKTAVHAHIRIKMSVLLKMNMKPTSSKAQQVGEFLSRTFRPVEVTSLVALSMSISQPPEGQQLAQLSDVLSSVISSCMIMTIHSG